VDLAGLGVDTWGVDFGFLGRGGEVLGSPYHYRDPRTDGVMDRTFAKVPKEKIFEATGIQFMQLNSLFQILAMKEAGSSLLDAAETMLFMPDLFNFLFTGKRKSEFSIATTSQMWDPRRKAWAVGLLEELGLPTRMLPEVIASGTVLGPMRADVAAECDVKPVPVIAPACHDTASAVAAVPADGHDWCYISSGTWSLMGVELPEPVINEKSLKRNYTNEGGVGGSIRFLKNIMGLWLVQECRRQWVKEGYEHSYAELTQMAAQSRPLAALIDPDHGPFLSPGDMPGKIERFCENTAQKKPAARGEFVRTCLESLALTYRKTLEGLEEVLGRKIAVIHIVGGGSQNELLNQMTADACGRTVIAGPVEATGIGNVLVQAMAVGQVKSLADARAIVRASFPVKRYEPKDAAKWDQAYARFYDVLGR
jgi:rhamnulokinase